MLYRMAEEGLLLLRTAEREVATHPLSSERGRKSPSICNRNPPGLAKAAGGCAHPWCHVPNLKITGGAHTDGMTLRSAVTSRGVSKVTQGSKGAARQ